MFTWSICPGVRSAVFRAFCWIRPLVLITMLFATRYAPKCQPLHGIGGINIGSCTDSKILSICTATSIALPCQHFKYSIVMSVVLMSTEVVSERRCDVSLHWLYANSRQDVQVTSVTRKWRSLNLEYSLESLSNQPLGVGNRTSQKVSLFWLLHDN